MTNTEQPSKIKLLELAGMLAFFAVFAILAARLPQPASTEYDCENYRGYAEINWDYLDHPQCGQYLRDNPTPFPVFSRD